MTQTYTKSDNKSTSKNEKESGKEDFSYEELKKYLGHKRIIPAHIVDDHSLKESQKSLYALLDDLSHHPDHFGYCFASNALLGKIMNMKIRALQRNLEILHKKGLIIVEVSQKFYHKSIRRIWTLDQFAIRDRLNKIYGNDEFNQRFYIHVKNDMRSCQKRHAYVAKEDISIREVVSPNIGCAKPTNDPQKQEHISPSATTAFSREKEVRANKPQKQQLPFSDNHKNQLRNKWGEKIANPIIGRIENMMREKPKSYTTTNPYDDASKFCAEASRKKANRFTKQVPEEAQKEIEEKNLDAINYFLETFKPCKKTFSCYSDTNKKTFEIVSFGSDKVLCLDYTRADFREKLYEWGKKSKIIAANLQITEEAKKRTDVFSSVLVTDEMVFFSCKKIKKQNFGFDLHDPGIGDFVKRKIEEG
jgi:hypothetical protein